MKHKRHSQISHRGRRELPSRNLKDLPYVSSEESGLEGHQPVMPASQPHLSRLRVLDTSSEMRSPMLPKQSLSMFPPYIQIPSIREWKASSRKKLVKGTICKLVLELCQDGYSIRQVLSHVQSQAPDDGQHPETYFTVEDIKAIKITCRGLDKRADSPLEAASYENEAIEGWWEESHCQKEPRRVPISKEVYEGTGDERWTKVQAAKNRDWSRTRSVSIGVSQEHPDSRS
jgi:hypothetical protein